MSPEFRGGYIGRILRVDLTNQKFRSEELPRELALGYIGGRGFGIKLLWDEQAPKLDPFSPQNLLIFSTGPLAATKAQSFCRFVVTTKSPLTGGYLRSTCGGWFAAELKSAGYDVLIIQGRAQNPVYLWIHDGKPELRDASHLWGIVTSEAEALIREETDPKARVACIGPAGERLVRYACIVSDRRTAARGGPGAVMGSKQLKAIAVSGTKEPEIADAERFEQLVEQQIGAYRKHPLFKPFHALGTNLIVYPFYRIGHFPTYNFKQLPLDGIWRYSESELRSYIIKHYGCHRCMLSCGKIWKITKGPYAGTAWDLPEYETLWAFGANCGNLDLESILYLNKLCDEYGLDTISTGMVLSFAMELFEKGLISEYETGGLNLRWGNSAAMVELTRRIALRDGFGNLLAEGVKIAGALLGRGAERYGMQIKGLEFPGYDPRAAKAHGLSLITSPCGANHTIGWSKQEIAGLPKRADPFKLENKAEIAIHNQNETAFFETGVACLFPATFLMMISPELYAGMLASATGFSEFGDPSYLWMVGERIFNLERAFNLREGFTRKDDTAPERFLKEPGARPPLKDQVFEQEQLLTQYYQMRGWDRDGVPTRAKLESLGLGDVANALQELGIKLS